MNASSVLQNVQDWLNDPGLTSGYWSLTELLYECGEASRTLADLTRFQSASASVPLSAGTASYGFPFQALDFTYMGLAQSSAGAGTVLKTEARILDALTSGWGTVTGTPIAWMTDRQPARTFRVYPSPSIGADNYTVSGPTNYGGVVSVADDGTWVIVGTWGGGVTAVDSTGVVAFDFAPGLGGITQITDGGFLWTLFSIDPKWLSDGQQLVDTPTTGTAVCQWPDAWARVLGLFVASYAWGKDGGAQSLKKSQHMLARFMALVNLAKGED